MCVKRPGVWRMINISRWHLCYNGSFTSRLDMTPQSKKYLFENVQTDWQTISMLMRQARVWLSNLSHGNYISGSLNHQSSHHFTVSLTFSHKYRLVIGLKIIQFWVCLVVHIVKVEQWRQLPKWLTAAIICCYKFNTNIGPQSGVLIKFSVSIVM